MHDTTTRRAIRSGVWLAGAAAGSALLLWLTVAAWGTAFPLWVGVVVVAASLLCGDIAERSVLRLLPRGPAADLA